MTSNQTQIITLGSVYIDINCVSVPFSEEGLKAETEVVGNDYEIVAGGSSLNFARVCQALGLPAVSIGKIGDDPLGTLLIDIVNQVGIRPEFVRSKAVATNAGLNLTNGAKQSIMAVIGNANQSLTLDDIQEKLTSHLAGASYLLISGCFKLQQLLPALTEVVVMAKKAGVQMIVDHGRLNAVTTEDDKSLVKHLASQADYYLPSTDELKALWGIESLEAGLEQLAPAIAGKMIVKDGVGGALAIVNGKVIRVDSFDVQAQHTVGAGDAFNAGLIATQIRGANLQESIRFACATAALYIAAPKSLSWNSIEKFLQERSST